MIKNQTVAPQVVADERVVLSFQSAFEKAAGGCIFGDSSRLEAAQDWFKQGYLAASPVHAQEPVDWQKIALFYQDLYSQEKHRAPVQPVAVPDGADEYVWSVNGMVKSGGDPAFNDHEKFILPAAPAAQGDAIALLEEIMRPYGIYDVAVSKGGVLQMDFIEIGNRIRAAIASKTAS